MEEGEEVKGALLDCGMLIVVIQTIIMKKGDVQYTYSMTSFKASNAQWYIPCDFTPAPLTYNNLRSDGLISDVYKCPLLFNFPSAAIGIAAPATASVDSVTEDTPAYQRSYDKPNVTSSMGSDLSRNSSNDLMDQLLLAASFASAGADADNGGGGSGSSAPDSGESKRKRKREDRMY